MSPTIVTCGRATRCWPWDRRVAAGSFPYVLTKTIIAYIDWQMDVQQAVSLPHMVNRFGDL